MQDRFYGVYPALVTANADEKHPGLIEVALPWCPDVDGEPVRAWARLATAMAGNGRGHWFIPDVDDEVLVSFEGGDPSRPYIMGALWNGKDKAPETMAEENNVKSITTRSGIKLTFDDTEDGVKVSLTTPGGHELILQDGEKDGAPLIRLKDTNKNELVMDKNGTKIKDVNDHTVTMASDGITLKHKQGSSATVTGSNIVLKVGGSEITVENASIVLKTGGSKVELGASAVKASFGASALELSASGAKMSSAPATVEAAPGGVTVSHAANSQRIGPTGFMFSAPPATVKFGPDGIMLMSPPAIFKMGPDGVAVVAAASIFKAGPDGITLIAPKTQIIAPAMVQVIAPMFQATSAMLQVAGVIQGATVVAPAVASPLVSKGPANIL